MKFSFYVWIISATVLGVLTPCLLFWECHRHKTSSTFPLTLRGRKELIWVLIGSLAVTPLAVYGFNNIHYLGYQKIKAGLGTMTLIPVILVTVLITDSRYKWKARKSEALSWKIKRPCQGVNTDIIDGNSDDDAFRQLVMDVGADLLRNNEFVFKCDKDLLEEKMIIVLKKCGKCYSKWAIKLLSWMTGEFRLDLEYIHGLLSLKVGIV